MGAWNVKRVYVGTHRSGEFIEVLPKELTVTEGPYGKSAWIGKVHRTMFRQVNIAPYSESKQITELRHRLEHTKAHRFGRVFIDIMYAAIKRAVFEMWDPGRFHVIPHSSGYDSRVLSQAIWDLYRQHGRDWLGDVLFVECGGEPDLFYKLLEKRWGRDKLYVWHEGIAPGMYNQIIPEDVPLKFNGPVAFPYNQWYDPFMDLTKKGVIPEGAQYFTGYGAYVENAVKKWGWGEFFQREYYQQLSAFRFYGDWYFPWLSDHYMEALAKVQEVKRQRLRISEIMAHKFCGSMAGIPRLGLKQVRKRGYRNVANISEIVKWYDNSWYGRHFKTNPSDELNYSHWWMSWVNAAYCEHLISKGYKLKTK